MRAVHKYRGSRNREHIRRIAQSMGYKFSIWDMPHMIALLERAGIVLNGENPNNLHADTDTISL